LRPWRWLWRGPLVEGVEELVPVYAEGFFHVAWGVIYYTIVFDYIERGGTRFWERMRDPAEREREEAEIAGNMQELMDRERVVVNGMDTRTIVDSAHIEFRGSRKRHSVVFHCRIPYTPVEGVNVYENMYSPTTAPYPYTVYWIAPPGGSIVSADMPGRIRYVAGRRILVDEVARGTEISGYESVEFRVPRPRLGWEAQAD